MIIDMKDKLDLTDVTFLIPVRLDSTTRIENLLMVLDFLHYNFNTNIHILEASSYCNNILLKLLHEKISYDFVEDYDPIFHRTKYINLMVKDCNSPFVAVWDADVIVPIEQIITSVQWLRKKNTDFVSPYKNKFLDTTYILRELYLKTRDIQMLLRNENKMTAMYTPNPVGGVFFVNRTKYIKAGMENEYFYGWGREDGDRINRWVILGFIYKRVDGPLFHFTHDRGINSSFHSPEQDNIKYAEIIRILAMSKRELTTEIEAWNGER